LGSRPRVDICIVGKRLRIVAPGVAGFLPDPRKLRKSTRFVGRRSPRERLGTSRGGSLPDMPPPTVSRRTVCRIVVAFCSIYRFVGYSVGCGSIALRRIVAAEFGVALACYRLPLYRGHLIGYSASTLPLSSCRFRTVYRFVVYLSRVPNCVSVNVRCSAYAFILGNLDIVRLS